MIEGENVRECEGCEGGCKRVERYEWEGCVRGWRGVITG